MSDTPEVPGVLANYEAIFVCDTVAYRLQVEGSGGSQTCAIHRPNGEPWTFAFTLEPDATDPAGRDVYPTVEGMPGPAGDAVTLEQLPPFVPDDLNDMFGHVLDILAAVASDKTDLHVCSTFDFDRHPKGEMPVLLNLGARVFALTTAQTLLAAVPHEVRMFQAQRQAADVVGLGRRAVLHIPGTLGGHAAVVSHYRNTDGDVWVVLRRDGEYTLVGSDFAWEPRPLTGPGLILRADERRWLAGVIRGLEVRDA